MTGHNPNETLPYRHEYTLASRTGVEDLVDKYGHQAEDLYHAFVERANGYAAGGRFDLAEYYMSHATFWRRVADDRLVAEALMAGGWGS